MFRRLCYIVNTESFFGIIYLRTVREDLVIHFPNRSFPFPKLRTNDTPIGNMYTKNQERPIFIIKLPDFLRRFIWSPKTLIPGGFW